MDGLREVHDKIKDVREAPNTGSLGNYDGMTPLGCGEHKSTWSKDVLHNMYTVTYIYIHAYIIESVRICELKLREQQTNMSLARVLKRL